MKVRLSKFHATTIDALVRTGMLGTTRGAVVQELIRRAIYDLVVTDYIRKLRAFKESLKL